jgi:hypothetical protein
MKAWEVIPAFVIPRVPERSQQSFFERRSSESAPANAEDYDIFEPLRIAVGDLDYLIDGFRRVGKVQETQIPRRTAGFDSLVSFAKANRQVRFDTLARDAIFDALCHQISKIKTKTVHQSISTVSPS